MLFKNAANTTTEQRAKQLDKAINNTKTALLNSRVPSDREILIFAEDLEVLKGYPADDYTKWVYVDKSPFSAFETKDVTSDVLTLARFSERYQPYQKKS